MGSYMGSINMGLQLILVFCVFLTATAVNLEDIADVRTADQKTRQPKLFYVSSSSTTSSISTVTVCFSSTSTGVTTCNGRKRRNILTEPFMEEASLIVPHRISDRDDDSFTDIDSGVAETESVRDGRFLLYWLTTMTTSTTTIFTGTSVLATLDCTPNGFTLNGCGGK